MTENEIDDTTIMGYMNRATNILGMDTGGSHQESYFNARKAMIIEIAKMLQLERLEFQRRTMSI